ncbi:hypothetical protein GEV43_08270 [Actinomadura sp. J1-007]|nr:hypothetical protein [Actinomadura sp. J1-007]
MPGQARDPAEDLQGPNVEIRAFGEPRLDQPVDLILHDDSLPVSISRRLSRQRPHPGHGKQWAADQGSGDQWAGDEGAAAEGGGRGQGLAEPGRGPADGGQRTAQQRTAQQRTAGLGAAGQGAAGQ